MKFATDLLQTANLICFFLRTKAFKHRSFPTLICSFIVKVWRSRFESFIFFLTTVCFHLEFPKLFQINSSNMCCCITSSFYSQDVLIFGFRRFCDSAVSILGGIRLDAVAVNIST